MQCVSAGKKAETQKTAAATGRGANATEQTGAEQTGLVNAAVNALSNINFTQVLPWGFMPLMGLQMFLAWWRDVKEIKAQRYVVTLPREIAEMGMKLLERMMERERTEVRRQKTDQG